MYQKNKLRDNLNVPYLSTSYNHQNSKAVQTNMSMIARLSTQNIIMKGCLLAAIVHLVILTFSNVLGHRDDIYDDSIKKRLIRERSKHHSKVGRVPWTTPVMHTFFEPVPGGCCSVSEEGHLNLLQTWEEAWQSKGWETRILNMDDVKEHKDFEKLKGVLDSLGVDEYNQRCFFRWLAMAESGGWMSDYDTFPMDFDAQIGARIGKYGVFTSFDSHIPSLISASKYEWDRVLQLIIKELEGMTKEDGFTSDMVRCAYIL